MYVDLYGLGYCKPGWLKHEGHCYFRNKTGDTWMNSKVGLEVFNILFSNKDAYSNFVKNRRKRERITDLRREPRHTEYS